MSLLNDMKEICEREGAAAAAKLLSERKPDGYALISSDGYFIGIWKDGTTARLVQSRSHAAKDEMVRLMIFAD